MVGLDTNVLVRYLTRDDESQWQQAKEVIESGQLCFIANIVLCELVWVLRGKPYRTHLGSTHKPAALASV